MCPAYKLPFTSALLPFLPFHDLRKRASIRKNARAPQSRSIFALAPTVGMTIKAKRGRPIFADSPPPERLPSLFEFVDIDLAAGVTFIED